MAIFGWLVLFGFVIWATGSSLFMLWFCLPQYNPIGGAKNTISMKVWAVVFFVVVALCWYAIVSSVPFTVTFK